MTLNALLVKHGFDKVVVGILAFIAGIVVSWLVLRTQPEAFTDYSLCTNCNKRRPCNCPYRPSDASGCPLPPIDPSRICPICPPMPDMSKYVLKSSIPPCPPMPDMTRYILKSDVPPLPDMSRYVLKSSVPKCPPCIAGCSKPCKIGECPPCERTRCPPAPQCPTATCPSCPSCAPCPRAICPNSNVTCKPVVEFNPSDTNRVRPAVASMSAFGL